MAISDSERRKYEDKLASLSWADGVPAPVDADGEVVPLTTKVVYDKEDTELTVRCFDFKSDGYNNGWTVFCALGPNFMAQPYGSQELHLHRPDSWEKLLDDLKNAAEEASNNYANALCCVWFNDGGRDCAGCPADESPKDSCNVQLVKNIAARIRRLRGDEDA